MEAIQFKRAELEDQEIIAHYFEHHTAEAVREHLPMFIFGPDNIR